MSCYARQTDAVLRRLVECGLGGFNRSLQYTNHLMTLFGHSSL